MLFIYAKFHLNTALSLYLFMYILCVCRIVFFFQLKTLCTTPDRVWNGFSTFRVFGYFCFLRIYVYAFYSLNINCCRGSECYVVQVILCNGICAVNLFSIPSMQVNCAPSTQRNTENFLNLNKFCSLIVRTLAAACMETNKYVQFIGVLKAL